jgi:hypothetical protein
MTSGLQARNDVSVLDNTVRIVLSQGSRGETARRYYPGAESVGD